jgi:hypothetical protein
METTKKALYRPRGDRRFFNPDIREVIIYMRNKHNLSSQQMDELLQFGMTQDGKYEIMEFTSI